VIPIRARIDSPITTFGVRPPVRPHHPLADTPCPVCDGPLTDRPITLVFVGVDPEQRAEGKSWAAAGAVAVHADCAGIDMTPAPVPM
jgi:hypothetical protein